MKTKTTGKEGVALVMVLFFMAAISTFLAMVSFSSSQRAYTAKRLTDDIKAKAMAEAGCEYGYAILSTDWEARYDASAFTNQTASMQSVPSSPEYQVSYANAQQAAAYDIDVAPVGTLAAIVTTTGTCGSASAVSVVSVQDIGGSSDDGSVLDEQAFGYGILCGKELHFMGCGSITAPGGAKFHANGAMILKGTSDANIDLSSSILVELKGNAKVNGNVTAKKVIDKKNRIQGTTTETSVPPISIPDIDLTPYYNWALAHGEVYNGYSSSSSYTPSGGIMWVNGDVNWSGGPGTTVNGSIIATGQIHLAGQVNVTPTTCAFGLVARDGEIQIQSSGIMRGLMYCKKSNFHMTSNGTIIGQIIVNGDIEKAGNSDILGDYVQSIPAPPDSTTTTDYIAISAWQK